VRQFETPVTLVSEKFDRMGDVKSFFDLIPKRGMVFITYVRTFHLPIVTY
jgi:hypothetical protein